VIASARRCAWPSGLWHCTYGEAGADAHERVIADFTAATTEEVNGSLVATEHRIVVRASDDARAVAADACKRMHPSAGEGSIGQCVAGLMPTINSFQHAAEAAHAAKWGLREYDDSAVGKLQAFVDASLDGHWSRPEPPLGAHADADRAHGWVWTDRSGRAWGMQNGGYAWNSTLRVAMYGSSHMRGI
jgi:hypothetical protein